MLSRTKHVYNTKTCTSQNIGLVNPPATVALHMSNPLSSSISAPSHPVLLNASQASVGAPISPIQRLQIMSAGEWEQFVLEWVDGIRSEYTDVHRCGGAGDLGRDVIGFKAGVNPESPWDNYQCKHYDKPLAVADAVAEIGKLLYHASQGAFSLPEKYTFVAPQGPSTPLLKVLQKGTLKQELMSRWNGTCRKSISKTQTIEMSQVQGTINSFDFLSVTVESPLKILAMHQKTPYYFIRFGGGLPGRVLPIPAPPAVLQSNEHIYIKKLLEAYGDEADTTYECVDALQATAPEFATHLGRSREQFFSAESLRAFSRDNVPPGTFESLQDEIFDGVQEAYEDACSSGYQRVKKTVQRARLLPITGNPLVGVMHNNDRAGICHQLANDDKMTWLGKKSGGEN